MRPGLHVDVGLGLCNEGCIARHRGLSGGQVGRSVDWLIESHFDWIPSRK